MKIKKFRISHIFYSENKSEKNKFFKEEKKEKESIGEKKEIFFEN